MLGAVTRDRAAGGGDLVGDPAGEFESAVHEVVRRIPRGHVMSYGDVAEYVGAGGPRQVGAVMARSDGELPWWRVLRADGSPPPHLATEALAAHRAEGTPMRPDGTRVDMRRARWDGR
jgi:alkylated DNA nucleotide flippase Atl1